MWTAIHIHHFYTLLPRIELLLLQSSWSCMIIADIALLSSCLQSWCICPVLKMSNVASWQFKCHHTVLTRPPYRHQEEMCWHLVYNDPLRTSRTESPFTHIYFTLVRFHWVYRYFSLIAIWEENQIRNSPVLLILELNVRLRSQACRMFWITLCIVVLHVKL